MITPQTSPTVEKGEGGSTESRPTNEECSIPRWTGSPQREIEIIRTALARRRALLRQVDQAKQAARQVLVEACRAIGLRTDRDALSQCLEDRLIEAEIAVAEGGRQ